MRFQYSRAIVPDNYECGNCNATGCKLWRDSSGEFVELRCVDCAAHATGKETDIATLDQLGRHLIEEGMTDKIGWFTPAIPVEEGIGFCIYSKTPPEGSQWWAGLPNRPTAIYAPAS